MDNILDAAINASAEMDKVSQRKELVQNIIDADDITQKQIAFMLKKDVFGTGPRNASELSQAIEALYGIKFSTKVSEDKWTPPFEWLHAMYFDTYPQLLGVAPRGSGKTLGASVITHFKCHHKPGYEATHLGARLEQAQVAQRYLANFQNDSILNEGMESIGLKKAKWNNGSLWMIVAGTMAGVSGQHPSMLSIDELEFLDVETLEQTWANPMDKNGYRRFWTGFSTRQRASSLMNILTQQAESGEKNIKLMQWSVFEVMRPCRECLCIKGGNVISEPEKTCPLWRYCHGEKARKVDGWMSRESVVNLMETMTQESFETQMLCLRPSSHGLVLSTFIADYATKLDINRGNYLNWTYQNSLPLYCWHDPADGGKSALCFVQIFGGKVFLFDELIMDGGPTIEKVKVALWEHCMAKGYSLPKFIVMDPHRAEVYGKIWQEGSPVGEGKDRSYMVEYPNMDGTGFADIEPGLELTRALICNGIGARTFFVNPIQAKGYVTAITNNRYKVDKTNIIFQGAKQELKYKDEIDSIRYGLIHAVQRLGIAANRRLGVYF